MKYSIVHLVDEPAAGEVARNLEFLASSPELARSGVHKVVLVRRGQLTAPRISADIIVSHLHVTWTNLPLFAALRAAYPRTPMVHFEHDYTERRVALTVKHNNRFETLFRSVMAIFDHVVALSDAQAQWMLRKGYCPGGRLSVIESCTDLAPFLASFPRASREPRVVGVIAPLETSSGVDILVQAFQDERLAHLELRVHGVGRRLKALKAMANGRANIVFMGAAVDQAAVTASCDVIAIASRWSACGTVALEAMAASRPVVCSRVDGTESHVDGGAIEVAQNTPESWVDILSRLSDFDLNAIRTRGRAHSQITRKNHIEDWNNLIHEVIGSSDDEKLAA